MAALAPTILDKKHFFVQLLGDYKEPYQVPLGVTYFKSILGVDKCPNLLFNVMPI